MQFSKYELWFLLTQMHPVALIGFRNPMAGVLTEDMFPIAQEASFSLLDKDLIYAEEGKIKMRDDIAKMVSSIAAPIHTILIGQRIGDTPKETTRSINFNGSQIALLEELVTGNYIIKIVDTKEDLMDLLIEAFSSSIFWSPDTDSLTVPQDKIVFMQNLNREISHKEAEEIMRAMEGDEQSKKHLVETLQSPKIRYSFVMFAYRNDSRKNSVQGFSVTAGERYIWMMEIADEAKKNVSVSKTTIKEINKKINMLIPLE